MNIVIIDHPGYSGIRSIHRYTEMLAKGLREKEHSVEIWRSEGFFCKLVSKRFRNKYLQYLDSFVVFPKIIRNKIKNYSPDTLFVFSDHALGPLIPLLKNRPHIVHCHDFMAQRSALGEISENKVSFTGKIYQSYIRKGYRQGKYFISISQKTQGDLHRFLNFSPIISDVVYNGLNQNFQPGNPKLARQAFQKEYGQEFNEGYILHVGGDLFYKNREGVVEIYNAWRDKAKSNVPLLFIGALAGNKLRELINLSRYSGDIYFFENVSDEILQFAYQGAKVLLYPSIDEGFGWPIAEAMASGCPVITTNKAPMNEVGGASSYYIPCRPGKKYDDEWDHRCAEILNNLLNLSKEERLLLIASGLQNARRFRTEIALEKIEEIYKKVLQAPVSLTPVIELQQQD